MRDTFSRVIKLYRARGYTGNVSVSGQFGIYGEKLSKWITESQTEKPSVDRYLHVVSGGSGASKVDDGIVDSLRIETEDSRTARLIRTLIRRMEKRASEWKTEGYEDINPEIGSEGTLGLTIPVINVGWTITVSLTVNAKALLHWQWVREQVGKKRGEMGSGSAVAFGDGNLRSSGPAGVDSTAVATHVPFDSQGAVSSGHADI